MNVEQSHVAYTVTRPLPDAKTAVLPLKIVLDFRQSRPQLKIPSKATDTLRVHRTIRSILSKLHAAWLHLTT
jgi:hypothetical protein